MPGVLRNKHLHIILTFLFGNIFRCFREVLVDINCVSETDIIIAELPEHSGF